MRARNRARFVVCTAVLVSLAVVAPPSVAEERNVRLYSAAFRGYGVVNDFDGAMAEVDVHATGGECSAVVLVGPTALVVPCTFDFEVPFEEEFPCTGIARGEATLAVELPYPPGGFRHEFAYDAYAVVDETSIYGVGTAEMDVGSLDVRTGWVKFGALPPKCNVRGPNVGTALY